MNTLINKANTYTEAMDVYTEMKEMEIPMNTVTMSTLINKANTYTEAMVVYTEMKEMQVYVDTVTMNTYLKVLSKDTTYTYNKKDFTEVLAYIDSTYKNIDTANKTTLHYILQNDKWYSGLHRDFNYIWLLPSTPAHIAPQASTQPVPAVPVSIHYILQS
jgi:hypothetical protein